METITDDIGRVLGPDPSGRYRYRVIHQNRFWTQWVTDDPAGVYSADLTTPHNEPFVHVALAEVAPPEPPSAFMAPPLPSAPPAQPVPAVAAPPSAAEATALPPAAAAVSNQSQPPTTALGDPPRLAPRVVLSPRMERGFDVVAGVLEGLGWIVAIGAVIGAIALFADAGSGYGSDNGQKVSAVVLGVAGVVQGLLLVGFGRMIGYLAAVTALQSETRELLRRAVDN